MPRSATEEWHQRMLFSGGRAEPDSFSYLFGLGWFDCGRHIPPNNIFLRAAGNLGDPDILLYHNRKKMRAEGSELRSLR